MTIIAYRDGVMASDSGQFLGSTLVGTTRKAIRTQHGFLVGCCGVAADCVRYEDLVSGWTVREVRAPNWRAPKFESSDDFSAIVVFPGGKVYRCSDKGWLAEQGDAPFYAMGSPEELAFGAMLAGASAIRAVQLCILHVAYAAGEVQVAYLDDAEQIAHERGQR